MVRNTLERLIKQFPFTILMSVMTLVMIPTMLLLGMPGYISIVFFGLILCVFLCELLIPILFK